MPRTRTRFPTELLVELRKEDPLPLHRQLEQELRAAIRTGRLQPETALPSTRVLADHWTVVTRDGFPSVHVEHTLAVTREGVQILTRPDEGQPA